MKDKRYIISDAAKMAGVEAHVLRYWEDELMLDIPRNEMGHRFYTDTHINLIKNVRELKEQGFQLKAIKMVLPDLIQIKDDEINTTSVIKEELINTQPKLTGEQKLEQFKQILTQVVEEAMVNNNKELGEDISNKVSGNVIKEMDYLLRLKEEREEERYKKIDEIIRNYQSNTSSSNARNVKKDKPSKFFKKNKRKL